MSASARGIVLQQDGERLVIQASPTDVVKFALGTPVVTASAQAQAPLTLPEIYALLDGDELLYSRAGVPIARVTEVSLSHGPEIDVTSYGDATSQYVYGLGGARYTIRAKGPI